MVIPFSFDACTTDVNCTDEVCSWFSPLLREVFSPGTPVFPSPQKPIFPISNSTRNQVEGEPLCGCATSKSLFIIY